MAFDLMAQLVDVAGNTVQNVGVTRLHENIYYATLWLKVKDRVHRIDTRPSDALTLASRVNAPISVAHEVFGDYSLPWGASEKIFAGLDTLCQKYAEKNSGPSWLEMEAGREWRSFRSLPGAAWQGFLNLRRTPLKGSAASSAPCAPHLPSRAMRGARRTRGRNLENRCSFLLSSPSRDGAVAFPITIVRKANVSPPCSAALALHKRDIIKSLAFPPLS